VYAKEVWMLVSHWTEGLVQVPVAGSSLEVRWNQMLKGHSKKNQQRLASLLIYIVWNIWKERNRRIFEGVSALPARVLAIIKEEVEIRQIACSDVAIAPAH
jgi:hypothetical protein